MDRSLRVTMVGSWPPHPGISAYCFQLAHAVGALLPLEYIGFKSMYPGFLYPGGAAPEDRSFPPTDPAKVTVRQTLTWYNPLGWMVEGWRANGKVLHVQFWSLPLAPILATVAFVARARGKKVLVTIHNFEARENRGAYAFALAVMIRLAHGIIAHTEPPRWLEEYCRRTGKILEIVPHGALDLFVRGEVDRTASRAEFGIPDDAPTFLFFGAIRPYKGLDLLLEAFRQVSGEFPDARILIAGRPWGNGEEYRQKIEALGLTERIDAWFEYIPTKDVPRYFAAADFVVLPYREFAAQSGVALAGVAFGIPLIVADVGGLASLQPDPRFVMQRGDSHGLAEILRFACRNRELWPVLQRSASNMAKEHQWSAVAAATAEVYGRLRGEKVATKIGGGNDSATGPQVRKDVFSADALPLVSYIVITMNRRDEIGACLDNLVAQDYPRQEWIVVDNGSSDGTGELVRQRYPRMKLVALAENQGVSGGRNRGAEVATGDILVFIDDDALFVDPRASVRAVDYFRENESLACVGFKILDARTGLEESKSIPRADKQSLEHDYETTYFCGAGFALRARMFREAGMFWEPLKYGGQELDLSYRFLDLGYTILHSASIEVLHHSTPTARPEGQWVYFNARDRSWVAVRNLPWIYVATTSIAWWANTALVAVRERKIRHFLKGIGDGLRGLPRAYRGRRCISRSTRRTLKSLSGRLAY
ncbi:MAG: glycosyltransferase [Planctomycetota bacterium]